MGLKFLIIFIFYNNSGKISIKKVTTQVDRLKVDRLKAEGG